jgi:1,6-anhydro-N-acetylmuramate kinase
LGSIFAIGLASSHESGSVGAALIASDGEIAPESIAYIQFDMATAARALISQAAETAAAFDRPGPDPLIEEADNVITMLYVEAVRQVLTASNKSKSEIETIGLVGNHIASSRETAPGIAWDWYLGKGDVIAKASEITVISGLPRDHDATDLKGAAEVIGHNAIRRLRLLPIGDAGERDLPIGVVHQYATNTKFLT